MISTVERDYISKGVEANIRADGRSRLDCRSSTFEIGLITQASGSCRLKIDNGTDVVVGVKVDVGSIEATEGVEINEEDDNDSLTVSKDKGKVICTVECSPSSFKNVDSRYVDDICTEYAQMLNRIFNGNHGGLDLHALCIIPGTTCWIVYVDVVILEYGGNAFDCIFQAVRGALNDARYPKATVEESAGHYEFEVADEETERLRGVENVPSTVTYFKIGSRSVLDPTPLEEMCSGARLTLAVNSKGNICAVQKGGQGGLEPNLLAEMIQGAKSVGLDRVQRMEEALSRESLRISEKEKPVGFS
ncbi:ribosomal protein S5 domain 2-type protein [Chytridium lagenaria]|nr:ribosomal protein S5 domain 2-type protein [Chytridium lagenaria]